MCNPLVQLHPTLLLRQGSNTPPPKARTTVKFLRSAHEGCRSFELRAAYLILLEFADLTELFICEHFTLLVCPLPYLTDRATRLGGPPQLSCKRDQDKIRNYMDRRVTAPRTVTSPTLGPPPPCKQALSYVTSFFYRTDLSSKRKSQLLCAPIIDFSNTTPEKSCP